MELPAALRKQLADLLPPATEDVADWRAFAHHLLGTVETLASLLADALRRVAELEDENRRLRGEHPRPTIAANRRPPDVSSERERADPAATPPAKKHGRRAKIAALAAGQIDETLYCPVAPDQLPADAIRLSDAESFVEDLTLTRRVVRVLRARYYSPSQHQTITAPLPPGYHGGFGPTVRALVPVFAHHLLVSVAHIHGFLRTLGLDISRGTVVQMTAATPRLRQEYREIAQAGLASRPEQHIDATPTRVNGQNQQCFAVGTDDYTLYRTSDHGDRQAVLDLLQGGDPRQYAWGPVATAFLDAHTDHTISARARASLDTLPEQTLWDDPAFRARLPHLPARDLTRVLAAARVQAYHQQTVWPVVDTLLCDDALIFPGLTAHRGLCWTHEGRRYKYLRPVLPVFQDQLTTFRDAFWTMFRDLRTYQQAAIRAGPDPVQAASLRARFSTLLEVSTSYAPFAEALVRTRDRTAALLRVLDDPWVDLTNNLAERDMRRRARKRDVSFGPRTDAGRDAWDIYQTIFATADKLQVNVLTYLADRLGARHGPSLAEAIRARAAAHAAARAAVPTSHPLLAAASAPLLTEF